MAYALVPGGPGTNPWLSYSVAVCGSQPFQGTLLIGGDARLSNLRGVPALGTRTTTSQSSFQDIPDVKLLDESTGNALDLGPVQAIQITMPSPVKCLSPFSDQQPFPSFEGQGQEISGEAAAPVQRAWRMAWWSGPRASQSWPLIGSIPGVSDQDLGVFRALGGLRGAWTRFIPQYFDVSVGSLNSSTSVDEARPQTASDTDLFWESAQPIQPVAVVTDTTAMNKWQNWLVAAGILLGVGGSLLASLLYAWAHPSRERSQNEQQSPRSPAAPGRSTYYKHANVVTVLVVLVWAIRRGKRHRE
ncbi:MAG TPA: hypothetical protein VE218_01575 [Acidobacteriaceae bacterium]|nr:hypothetical protein [Acidobacteriaceae bacterium]